MDHSGTGTGIKPTSDSDSDSVTRRPVSRLGAPAARTFRTFRSCGTSAQVLQGGRLSCRRAMRVPVRARKPIWMAVECWSAHIELLSGSGEEQIDDQDLSDASLRAV